MSNIILKNCYYIQVSPDQDGIRGQDILIGKNRIQNIAPDISMNWVATEGKSMEVGMT